jgi:hypothetical protein
MTRKRTAPKPTKPAQPAQVDEVTATIERPRGNRTPDAIFRARIEQVRGCLVAGMRPAQIYTLVASMPAKNKERLKKAADAKKDAPDVSVWGTGEPVPPRTVERYIHLAKRRLEKHGRTLPTLGEQIMGTQWARINMVFYEALKRERYHVCARMIEHTTALFQLAGAIKVQILPGDTPPEQPDNRPVATMTEASAVWEMREMLRVAMNRRNPVAPIAGGNGSQN